MKICSGLFTVLMLAIITSTVHAGIPMAFGHTDTFEDGTTMGWGGGSTGTIYSNVPTGGPAGDGDGFLKVESDTDGAHLGTQNQVQWGGRWWKNEPRVDLLTNNITVISADLKNLGSIPLDIRLVMTGDNSGGGRWVYTDKATLEVGSDWTHVQWQLDQSKWTPMETGKIFSKLLLNLGRITIHHDPDDPSAHGGSPSVTHAALGIDNVAAVPEPAMLSLLSIGIGVLAMRRKA